jgi:hypothetical protein
VRLLYISNGNIPSERSPAFQAMESACFDHGRVLTPTWRRRAAEILERFAGWLGRVA